MTRNIKSRLYIAWDGTNYVDESSRLIAASGANRFAPPNEPGLSSRGQVDECTLELANQDGRYSPLNTSSPLNDGTEETDALINGGAYHRPMYLEVSINNGTNYYRVFTGVIKLPQEVTPTGREGAKVTIRCRSKDELLLGMKMSTLLSAMTAWAGSGYTDGQIVEALLISANVIDYTVDHGYVPVTYAWLDDESVLDEIWQIAGACNGRFYCDPDGEFRYEDSAHWLSSTTATETLTRASFAGLQPVYNDNELFNTVTVETSPRQIDVVDVLWEPDEMVTVAPGETKTITARLKQAAWQIDGIEHKATTAAGADITTDVSMSQTNYVQRVEIEYTNSNATHMAYMRPLQITGKALKGAPTAEVSRNSTDHGFNATWWTSRNSSRSKTVRGNPYIQTEAHANAVALMLLHRGESPRLTYRLSGCAGVASRRCGNRITINDTAIMSSARDAFITAITWRLNSTGFQQDIEAVDAAQLYPYMDDGGYFILGDGTPASSKVGTGVGSAYLWY